MNKKHMCEARAKKGLAPVYVAVYDYSGDYAYLEDEYILGWSNRSDWYTDICGDEILTPSGNLKKSTTDFIQVGRGDGALVSRDFAYVKEYAAGAIEEGDNLTVCELKKDDEDAWILVRAEGGASNLEESFIELHERKSTAKNKNLVEVYKILDKYGRVDEDVDVVFRRAPLVEQRKMVKLLKEGRVDKDAAEIAKLRIEKHFPNVSVCVDGIDRDVLLIPDQGCLDFNTADEIVTYVNDLSIKGKKFAVEMYTQDKDNPDEVVGLGQCNLSRGELLKAEWYCVADIVDKNEYYGK